MKTLTQPNATTGHSNARIQFLSGAAHTGAPQLVSLVHRGAKRYHLAFAMILAMMLGFIQQSIGQGTVTQTFNYTSSGDEQSFTVPAGVTSITSVAAWGGGGAGRGIDKGAGGGGGAYSLKNNITLILSHRYRVVVGGGGGSTYLPYPYDGGDSFFKDIDAPSVLVNAKGGKTAVNTVGSAGGPSSGGIGDIRYSGGKGGSGGTLGVDYGGAGGTSAGTSTDGANGFGAIPGTTPTGGGSGGAGATSAPTTSTPGSLPGGGGGGRVNSTYVQSNGADGKVVITWTCPTYALTSASATTVCGSGTSTVTLTSSTLPGGTYTVTYSTTNPETSGNTATMVFSGTTGTFSTISASTITVGTLSCGTAPAICSSTISSNNTATVTVSGTVIPTFTQVGPLCQNATTPTALPTSSTNTTIITGTWAPVFSTATVGTRTYTFTPNAGQCATTATMNIEITSPVIPTFTQVGPLCQNATTPTALPTSSTNSITGSWAPAFSTATVGTRTYTFTPDAGQCAAEATMDVTVSPNVVPSVSIAADPAGPICAGTSVTFTATPTNGGTPSYQWKVNGGNVGSNSATFPTTALTDGDDVTCVMTSTASCVSPNTATSDPITMTVNAVPTITSTIPAERCGPGTMTLGATSSGIINWYGASTGGSPLGTGPSFTTPPITVTTTYYADATDNGCTSPRTPVEAKVKPFPTAIIESNSPVCEFLELHLTASFGASYTYSWTGPAGVTIPAIYNPVIEHVAPLIHSGTYRVTVTENGCSTQSDPLQVLIVPYPNFSVSSNAPSNSPLCEGQGSTLNLTSTDGVGDIYSSYSWTGPNFSSTERTPHIDNVAAAANGTYTVNITHLYCDPSGAMTTEVYINPLPAAPTATLTQPACASGTGMITVTAPTETGMTYSIDGLTYTNTTGIFPLLAPNTYIITARSAAGCVSEETSVTITAPDAIAVGTSAHVNASCYGTATGSITLGTVSGGTMPYAYSWTKTGDVSFSASTANLSSLTAGTYNYSVTDANSCAAATGSVIITQPIAVTVSASSSNVSCNGLANGTINVSGVSSGATTIIQLNGAGADLSAQTNFAPGTYVVTASAPNGNANGSCTATATVTITQPAIAVSVGGVATNASCFGLSDGSIAVTNSAGSTVVITNSSSVVVGATGLPAGVYTLTATAPGGNEGQTCTATATVTITQPIAVTVTAASVSPTSVCGSGTVTFSATASTGSITWYNALTGGNVVTPPTSINSTTTLYAEAVSPQGCISAVRTPVTATVNVLPASPIAGTNTYTYDGTPKIATASMGVGETIDWYTASTGGTATTAPSGTNAGSYTAYAEARNTTTGCLSATRTFVTLTITRVMVTVTANAGQTKVYGATDPVFTYSSSPTLVSGDSFTGALSRVAGENIGTYAFTLGTLSAGPNYTLSISATPTFSITARPITITPTAGQTKVYGLPDPLLYIYTPTPSLITGDSFTGALDRVTGENVGSYAYTLGTLTAGPNYSLSLAPTAGFSITPLPVAVFAVPISKVYGEPDPALTFISVLPVGTPLLNGQVISFTGSLSRAPGESVAGSPYAINQGSLANSNYIIGFVGADLTITPLAVTVTADSKTKVYGEADPALTYHFSVGSLVSGDGFTGALARVTGENVGNYAIQRGTLALNSNYTLTYAGANLSITRRAITVTKEDKSKTYGDIDPPLTYHISYGSPVFNDVFTGALERETGENAGTYQILPGTLALNSNYTITYEGANLTITKLAVTVNVIARTKVYGEIDPPLTFISDPGVGSHLPNGLVISFSGSLERETGESVDGGTYEIYQGSLDNGNYDITYENSYLVITPLTVTVNAQPATKVYGQLDPTLTYVSVPAVDSPLANGDRISFTGSLTRLPGETVEGSPYAMRRGDLNNSNYIISFVGANLTITQMAVTVTADAKFKVPGAIEPPLTFVSNPVVGFELPNHDLVSFTGELSRAQGEAVGIYPIGQNTVANSNYFITYVGANLTISTATAIKPVIQGELGLKVYPNPFADHLFFELRMQTDAKVNLEIFTLTGVKLATVFSENVQAYQDYRIEYTPENVSTGMLIYRLSVNGKLFFTGKVIHK